MAGAVHGGAEAFFERLTLAQHRAGLPVLAVIRRNADRAARLSAGGLAPVELPFGGALDLTTGRRLRATLEAFRPQVVVAWMNRAATFCRGASRGAPWTLVGRLGGQYDLRYYRGCDILAANTRGLCDWIAAQGWPRERLKHLPNFADDFSSVAPADLPVPAGARVLLALGRLHPNKDFATLLRALAQLPPDVHLALAGEGPERTALDALARELGVAPRVAFLGWRSDIGALLAASDMLVVPSRIEPLGNVVLEGFSASRPVVAAAADGPREVIEDGRTGMLVPIADHAAMAAAIAALLADPARAQAVAAAARAEFETRYAEAPVLAAWSLFLQAAARIRG
ncbi:glycosyltransferase [Falsiroseomonas oryziterrae]|uniref:glycosyltransferase n=1 Tax=Falsiroseomonas oryziterrae TaxID=2911368 RepID=UPI001F3D1639|nr:glycosyltransferase [Roseomonas sp. NPKOSM-4]